MDRTTVFWPAFMNLFLPLVLALSLSGCSGIKLVADYDENMDRGVTELHKLTEELLVKLESASGTAAATYENNRDFYADAKVKISTLRLRADAISRNSLTVKMLDKLRNNIYRLEADHKEGISATEIPLYRGGLNSQFTAILTFELAKKRGEKPNEGKAAAPPTALAISE